LTIAAVADDGGVHAVITHAPRVSRIAPAVAAAEPYVANRLLAALPAREYARLAPCLEPVTLTYGEVLYEPGQRMRHVYFPGVCLVSLLTLVEGHRALEVGLVGREGMIGARLAIGAATSPVRALVLGTGTALRMKAAHFSREFRRSPALQRALLRFTDDLVIQVSHTAACNRFHVVESRLARWLLLTAERMERMDFHLTHAFLADMLGVRREGVTEAAGALQRRRLIHYRRGDITILDQPGLEAACCSCYHHLRLMSQDATMA
jgi:CRP-like cAMP-binding protein